MKNVVLLPDRKKVQHEAAVWIMRLDEGPLRETDEAELQAWIAQSQIHYQILLEQAEGWAQADVLEQLREHMPVKAEFLKEPTLPGRFSSALQQPVWLTVFVLFGLLLSVTLMNFPATPQPLEVSSKVGEVKKFVLADQSTVTLNTNSRALIQFSKNRRKVTLLKGEASFKVTKNPEVPFVVYAGKGISWAVGTEFVVRKALDTVEIVVTEGEVKVFSNIRSVQTEDISLSLPLENKRSEAFITRGQKVSYKEKLDSVETLDADSVEQKVAWKQNSLIFRGETLKEAISEIQRYVAKEIVITEPKLLKEKVGGRFKFDNTNNLLLAIEAGWGLHASETKDVIFLSRNTVSADKGK